MWELTAGQYNYMDHTPLNEIAARVPADVGQNVRFDYGKLKLWQEGAQYYMGIKEGAAPDMMIDFGAYAKGWAADRAAEICAEHAVDAAQINIAGNVNLYGGDSWKIRVTEPKNLGEYFVRLESGPLSAVTSGAYERNFIVDGDTGAESLGTAKPVYVTHIIDPRTGWPINLSRRGDGGYANDQGGVVSVSVFCESSALADTYATVVCVKGLEKGLEFLKQRDIAGIIITDDMRYALSKPMTLAADGNEKSTFHLYGVYGNIGFPSGKGCRSAAGAAVLAAGAFALGAVLLSKRR
ncbi:hypothetical protein FACS1894211_13470 [Clostridia bacterium]|nr:hypothetical protein FACS1894211_13470 [Clostridia bacterium]